MSYLAAIYPETAAILGYCRGEAIYSRDCVHLVGIVCLFVFVLCVWVGGGGGGGFGELGAFRNVEAFTYTEWYSK